MKSIHDLCFGVKFGILKSMLPVLFSIGSISISSFGFFLSLGFLFGTFLVWRLARAWDFDEEKILDLTLLTFFGGLIFSRIYFVAEHLDFFLLDPLKMLLFTKYPGLSFWGAFLGGWLTLHYFTKRFKMDFWQLIDVAAVGFLGGLVLADLGCFLGGCGVGKLSNFLGVNMVGFVGERFPVQILESLIFLILLIKIWPKAIHFHTPGKIASSVLIYIGISKFILDFFRDQNSFFLSLIMVFLGLGLAHKISKKTLKENMLILRLKFMRLLTDKEFRERVIQKSINSWYNGYQTNFFSKRLVRILRKIYVRTHPKSIS